jgi:hypothetical protein
MIGHIHIRTLMFYTRINLMFAPVPPLSPNSPPPTTPHTHPWCRVDLTQHVCFDPTVPIQRVTLIGSPSATLSYRSCTGHLCPERCPNTHPLTAHGLSPLFWSRVDMLGSQAECRSESQVSVDLGDELVDTLMGLTPKWDVTITWPHIDQTSARWCIVLSSVVCFLFHDQIKIGLCHPAICHS